MHRYLTIALLLAAAPALADDEATSGTYRAPLVAVDVASAAMVVVPLSYDGDLPISQTTGLWTARVGVAMLAVGGSAVHAIHGEYGRALGSVLLRSGGAALGMAAGSVIGSCDGFCNQDSIAIGAVAGVGAAMVVEAVFYAGKPAPKERTVFMPYVAGSELGVAGRF